MRRFFILPAIVSTLSACAAAPLRAQHSELEDIPVPKGLELDWSRSTIIESPTIKAARLFYDSRLEPASLAVAFRTTLEANGWRHLSSTTAAEKRSHPRLRENGQLAPGPDLRRLALHLGGSVGHSGHRAGASPSPLSH